MTDLPRWPDPSGPPPGGYPVHPVHPVHPVRPAGPPLADPLRPLYPGATFGTPPVDPYRYGPGYAQQPPPATNGMAVAALVVSVVGAAGLVCYGLGGYLGLVGAILGHVARRQIRQRGGSGDGMALAGVIVGWIALGLAVVATALLALFVVVMINSPGGFEAPPADV